MSSLAIRQLMLAFFAAPLAFHAVPASAQAGAQPAYAEGPAALGEVLRRFARQSGFDIVFPEALVHGLVSGRAGPTPNPHLALQQILRGTGLTARFIRPDAVVLERRQPADSANMTLDRLAVRRSPTRAAQYQWYGERLLGASLSLLRDTRELTDKSYELFVYLWIDDTGRVTASRAYGSAGAVAVAAVLDRLDIKETPPIDMPQPVGLRIASQ